MKNNAILGIFSSSVLLFLLLHIKCSNNNKSKKCKKSLKSSKPSITEDDLWNCAFFFPDYFPERNENKQFCQLVWYLDQAKDTIDICVFGFTFKMLQDELVRVAKEKGVKIRLITNGSVPRVRSLRLAGIQTRIKIHIWKNPIDRTLYVDLMHHKFVVIDSSAVITGSLNWTSAAITENKENVMVTNHSTIVNKFGFEFEKLWKECCPSQRQAKSPRTRKPQ